MKKYLLIFSLLFCSILKAQTFDKGKQVDTLSIVFKAKLFTISQYEYESKQDLIDFINKLPYEIYGANEFIFIKIKSRYYCQKDNDMFTLNWCECDYYVCYSIKKNFFYLLGGFKTDNIKDFEKEYNHSVFITNWKYKIADKKLSEFINYMNLHKVKKAIKCFEKCTETIN